MITKDSTDEIIAYAMSGRNLTEDTVSLSEYNFDMVTCDSRNIEKMIIERLSFDPIREAARGGESPVPYTIYTISMNKQDMLASSLWRGGCMCKIINKKPDYEYIDCQSARLAAKEIAMKRDCEAARVNLVNHQRYFLEAQERLKSCEKNIREFNENQD